MSAGAPSPAGGVAAAAGARSSEARQLRPPPWPALQPIAVVLVVSPLEPEIYIPSECNVHHGTDL